MIDERLEMLSENVRMGIPVGMNEAFEVIAYQEELRKNKKQSLWNRLINWLRV